MRRLITGCLCAGLFAVTASPVSAAAPAPTQFRPCGKLSAILCGRVIVPLDRSGHVPGTISLRVERLGLPGRSRGAVFAIAGGPGQAATPFTEDTAFLFRKVLDGREVVTFDQRGTGRSGLLRCPTLDALGDRTTNASGAAADCAELLGPRRAFYTTRDSVEDLEAVRQAIGIDRITLYGVSYGTKLALAYAAAHPEHVERLVLDSVVDVDGPDPFERDGFAAMPRILRDLCATRCSSFTNNPVNDLTSFVRQLSKGILRGPLVRDDGRVSPARLGRLRLLDILFAGDFDPTLRAALPSAVRSGLQGDPAPILRLAHRGDRVLNEPLTGFSSALFAATVCEEGPLPWSRTTPFDNRLAQASAVLAATPDKALEPFDRATAFYVSEAVELCRLWPQSPTPPTLASGAFPAVPTLILSGQDDLRTPLEVATAVARRLPRATVVSVPNVGHSVLDWPNAICARRALVAFFRDRLIQRCNGAAKLVPVEKLAPTALAQLKPQRGRPVRVGRTLTAVERTLEDTGIQFIGAAFALDVFRPGIGGLRGGTTRFKSYGFALDHVEYVPGVRVSGQLRGDRLSRGFIRVTGAAAASGRMRLRHGVLRGRLGGGRVRLRLPADVLGGDERRGRPRRPPAATDSSPLARLLARG
jgi:pimeloyl-ACP methyl ester carboxylesterase